MTDPATLNRFSLALFNILNTEPDSTYGVPVPGGFVSFLEKPQFELASEAVFAFHINTTTGETALARWTADGDVNEWLDLGMQITPAP